MLSHFRVMFRLASATLLIALSVMSASSASAATAGHKKVYLLRGLTNVLSPGIDHLNEELQRRNVDVTIANHAFSDSLALEAIDGCKSGRISSIVLVGHSLGASAAVSMAEQLQRAGLHVALIVTIDPVTKIVVPNNVHVLRNYFLSSGVGTVVERNGRFRGTLQNVDMGKTEYGHVSLTNAPVVQNQAMRDILSANSSCR
jgi:ABC-type sugar transport system substrate-binding protein